MAQKQIQPKIRQMTELQYSEIVGRLHACETLENEAESVDDPRVLYGWNMLTQEVLLRAAEASLKLLYLLHFEKQSKRGHDLSRLWEQLPKSVQVEVETERKDLPGGEQGVSFAEYDEDTFRDVRYSHESRLGGQSMMFEHRRLYLDCLSIASLAEKWLGEIRVWPWAGFISPDLAGYKIIPVKEGKFDVVIDNPIEPMDWAGAVIEKVQGKYSWTLYFGYTDKEGESRGFKIPSFAYQWPINELFHETVGKCAEQIHRAYQEPGPPLLAAIKEAESEFDG